LERYSEDLDFSLLKPDRAFSLGMYGKALCREISSFGFSVEYEDRKKRRESAIESVFLKANTYQQLVVIGIAEELLHDLHPAKKLKIRLEVDTDPPGNFETEARYVMQPIPFPIRTYSLPDLFAGKLHAIMCRKWKTRVKGRDWYDLVWFISNYPHVRLTHLETRMRQSGDFKANEALSAEVFQALLLSTVNELNVEKARGEVLPFIRDQRALDVWSREFFTDIVTKIIAV
jgi:predicted nucleotidyltransferase component of viral defense system